MLLLINGRDYKSSTNGDKSPHSCCRLKKRRVQVAKVQGKFYLSLLSHSDANYIHDILTGIKRVWAKYEYLL